VVFVITFERDRERETKKREIERERQRKEIERDRERFNNLHTIATKQVPTVSYFYGRLQIWETAQSLLQLLEDNDLAIFILLSKGSSVRETAGKVLKIKSEFVLMYFFCCENKRSTSNL
jgi:hypothetical protein